MPGVFAGQGSGKTDEASFTRGVDRLARRPDTAGVRRNTNDPAIPALDHTRQHHVMHIQGANQIDIDNLAPEFRISFQKWTKQIPACVIDKNIDPAQCFFDL